MLFQTVDCGNAEAVERRYRVFAVPTTPDLYPSELMILQLRFRGGLRDGFDHLLEEQICSDQSTASPLRRRDAAGLRGV